VNALSDLLPLTVGMAISPLPVVAVVAIVLAPRGRVAAPLYVATFTAVSFVLLALGAVVAVQAPDAATKGGHGVVSLVLSGLIAVGFAVLAVVSWRSRPRAGATPKAPTWMAAIDTITPGRAIGLGLLMAAANSKNLPLAVKGGAVIADAHVPLLTAVLLCAAVAVGGSVLLIVPAAVSLGRSASITRALEHIKAEMIASNAQMMTVLFAVLAADQAATLLHHLFS